MHASGLDILVLPLGYTTPMAKVMISLPGPLLAALDAEAERRHTTRSGLLQEAARRELGQLRRDRAAVIADLDALAGTWQGPLDAVAMIRADRRRDG
jgi:hypothetical protein